MENSKFFKVQSLKKGSEIKIKEENRGKFTDYCNGKVTQECIDQAKNSGNKTLIKRATFAENVRKWKHKNGGNVVKLIPKHENGTPEEGIQRLDITSLKADPEYKKNYNWYINDASIEALQDSLIGRNAGYAQRLSTLAMVIPESGGKTDPHGNGANGLVGWRGTRAENLPEDLPGQINNIFF